MTIDGLMFGIEKSIRYHQRRRAHYEELHKAVMLGVIVSGSAAFANSMGHGPVMGLVAAILGAVDLVFAFSHRARDHEILHRRFTELANRCRRAPESDVTELERIRMEIETDEPPIYWEVESDCYMEVAAAWGRKVDRPQNWTWWRRAMMHWWRFEGAPHADA